jgi:indolepyruvate ferredoxin oxidoreductase
MSHVRLADAPEQIHATRVGTGAADLVIGCDVIVAASKDAISRMGTQRTHAALNSTLAPTAAFVKNPDWKYPDAGAVEKIRAACGNDAVAAIDAGKIATALMGDAIATNMFMLGYAWQQGWVPLLESAILQSIALNGVSIEFNQQSFAWGRLAAHDLSAVEKELSVIAPGQVITFKRTPSLDELVAQRSTFLRAYQNQAYAKSYVDFINQVKAAEAKLNEGNSGLKLTTAVAKYLFKLMAYKDEYEVARLHSNGQFKAKIAGMFEGDYAIKYHLAPPLFSKHDAQGHLIKREFGSWVGKVFPVLASLRFLRGSLLDPFGYTEERRSERALIQQYKEQLLSLLTTLNANNYEQLIAIASIPEDIRGYGHVKERHLRAAKQKESDLLASFSLQKFASDDQGKHAA